MTTGCGATATCINVDTAGLSIALRTSARPVTYGLRLLNALSVLDIIEALAGIKRLKVAAKIEGNDWILGWKGG
jgi:hypothetical protein